MKKRIVLIVVVIIAIIAATMIYQTYATNSSASSSGNVHTITLSGTSTVNVPAGGSKTVIYQITNTNKGVVQYGVAYKGDNVIVKAYTTSPDTSVGTIDYGENKFVKLYIKNNSTTDSIVNIEAVLGYENGGDLILPSGYNLVSSQYYDCSIFDTATECIKTMYLDNKDKLVKNGAEGEEIEYQYATSVNLMNDRLGGTTEDYDAGNIRYYGSSPNNYIYFNCDDYKNQTDSTCEKWRIIGIFDNHLKIVRDDIIGEYALDLTCNPNHCSISNVWFNSTLSGLLNGGYYSNLDGVSYWSNGGYSAGPIIIDFATEGIGIKPNTRNLIFENSWFAGKISISYDSASNERYSHIFYQRERGAEVWRGNVALVNPSDFGYAVDFSVCNEKISSYYKDDCDKTNWLIYDDYAKRYLLNATTDNDQFAITNSFVRPVILTSDPYGIQPTLYLNSELAFDSIGDGTKSNPYRLIYDNNAKDDR